MLKDFANKLQAFKKINVIIFMRSSNRTPRIRYKLKDRLSLSHADETQ